MRKKLSFVVILFLFVFSGLASGFEYTGYLRNRLIKNSLSNSAILNPNNQLGLPDNSLENTNRLILKQIFDNAKVVLDLEGAKDLLNDSQNYNIIVNESYYSFNVPSFNLLVGKKKIDWGTGFAWNPSDQINKHKNPLDIYENREGANLFKLDFSVLDSDITGIYQLSSSESGSGRHIKISKNINNFNVAAYYSKVLNENEFAGIMGTGYITDRWEFHFETATQRGRIQPLPNYNPVSGVYSYVADPDKNFLTSYLCGFRYSLSEKNFYAILEYYKNSRGYSGGEGQTYFDYLKTVEQKPVKTPIDNAYIAQSLNISSTNFQDQYTFVCVRKSNDLNTLEIGFDSIFSLADGSGVIIPLAKKVVVENLEAQLRLLHFWGSNHSEFGNYPMKDEAIFDCVYYF